MHNIIVFLFWSAMIAAWAVMIHEIVTDVQASKLRRSRRHRFTAGSCDLK